MKIGKNTLEFLVMTLIGFAMFYLVAFILTPIGPFSRYPAAILVMFIGISFLMYMIRMHLGGYTIKEAIKEDNITFGLIALAYALVIAAVLNTI